MHVRRRIGEARATIAQQAAAFVDCSADNVCFLDEHTLSYCETRKWLVRINGDTFERSPLFDHALVASRVPSAADEELLPIVGVRVALRRDDGVVDVTVRLASSTLRFVDGQQQVPQHATDDVPLTEFDVGLQFDAPASVADSDIETAVEFVNESDEPFETFWIDSDGHERSYGQLVGRSVGVARVRHATQAASPPARDADSIRLSAIAGARDRVAAIE